MESDSDVKGCRGSSPDPQTRSAATAAEETSPETPSAHKPRPASLEKPKPASAKISKTGQGKIGRLSVGAIVMSPKPSGPADKDAGSKPPQAARPPPKPSAVAPGAVPSPGPSTAPSSKAKGGPVSIPVSRRKKILGSMLSAMKEQGQPSASGSGPTPKAVKAKPAPTKGKTKAMASASVEEDILPPTSPKEGAGGSKSARGLGPTSSSLSAKASPESAGTAQGLPRPELRSSTALGSEHAASAGASAPPKSQAAQRPKPTLPLDRRQKVMGSLLTALKRSGASGEDASGGTPVPKDGGGGARSVRSGTSSGVRTVANPLQGSEGVDRSSSISVPAARPTAVKSSSTPPKGATGASKAPPTPASSTKSEKPGSLKRPKSTEVEVVRTSCWSHWFRCIQLSCILTVMTLGVVFISVVCMVGSAFSVDFATENLVNSTATLVTEETQRWSLEAGLWAELQGRAWARTRAGVHEAAAFSALSSAVGADSIARSLRDDAFNTFGAGMNTSMFVALQRLADPQASLDSSRARLRSFRTGLVAELWRRGDAVWGEVLDVSSGTLLGGARRSAAPGASPSYVSSWASVAPRFDPAGTAPPLTAQQQLWEDLQAPVRGALHSRGSAQMSAPPASTGDNCACFFEQDWTPPAPFVHEPLSPAGAGTASTLHSPSHAADRWGAAPAQPWAQPSWWWQASASTAALASRIFLCANDDAAHPWTQVPIWYHAALLQPGEGRLSTRLPAAQLLAAASSRAHEGGALGGPGASDDPLAFLPLATKAAGSMNTTLQGSGQEPQEVARRILQRTVPTTLDPNAAVRQRGCLCAPASQPHAWLRSMVAARPYLAGVLRPNDAAGGCGSSTASLHNSSAALPASFWSVHSLAEVAGWGRDSAGATVASPAPNITGSPDDLVAVLSLRHRIPAHLGAAFSLAEAAELAGAGGPAVQEASCSGSSVVVTSLAIPLSVLSDRLHTVSGEGAAQYVDDVLASGSSLAFLSAGQRGQEDTDMCVGLSTGSFVSAQSSAADASSHSLGAPGSMAQVNELLHAPARSSMTDGAALGQGAPDPAQGTVVDATTLHGLWQLSVARAGQWLESAPLNFPGSLGSILGQASAATAVGKSSGVQAAAARRREAFAAPSEAGGMEGPVPSAGILTGEFYPLPACSGAVLSKARRRFAGTSRYRRPATDSIALAAEGTIATPFTRTVLANGLDSSQPALLRLPWQTADQADRFAAAHPLSEPLAYTAHRASRQNAALWWEGGSASAASLPDGQASSFSAPLPATSALAAWQEWYASHSRCSPKAFARPAPDADPWQSLRGMWELPAAATDQVWHCDDMSVLPAPASGSANTTGSHVMPPWTVTVAVSRTAFAGYLWYPLLVPTVLTLVILVTTLLVVAQAKYKMFTHAKAACVDCCHDLRTEDEEPALRAGSEAGPVSRPRSKAGPSARSRAKSTAGRQWTTNLLQTMADRMLDPEQDGPRSPHAPPRPRRRVSVVVGKGGKAHVCVVPGEQSAGGTPSPAHTDRRRESLGALAKRRDVDLLGSARSAAMSTASTATAATVGESVSSDAAMQLAEEEDEEELAGQNGGIGRTTLAVMFVTFGLVLVVYLQWTSAWSSVVGDLNTAVVEVQGYRAARAVQWAAAMPVALHALTQRMLGMSLPSLAPPLQPSLAASLTAAVADLAVQPAASRAAETLPSSGRAPGIASSSAALSAALSSLSSPAQLAPSECVNGTHGAWASTAPSSACSAAAQASMQQRLDAKASPLNTTAVGRSALLRRLLAATAPASTPPPDSEAQGNAAVALQALLAGATRTAGFLACALDSAASALKVGVGLPQRFTLSAVDMEDPLASSTFLHEPDAASTAEGVSVTVSPAVAATGLVVTPAAGPPQHWVAAGGALAVHVSDGGLFTSGGTAAPPTLLFQSGHMPFVAAADVQAAAAAVASSSPVQQRTVAWGVGGGVLSLSDGTSASPMSSSHLVLTLASVLGVTTSTALSWSEQVPRPLRERASKVTQAMWSSPVGPLGLSSTRSDFTTPSARGNVDRDWYVSATETMAAVYGPFGGANGAAAELALARQPASGQSALCTADMAATALAWEAASLASGLSPMHATAAALASAGSADPPRWGPVTSFPGTMQRDVASAGAMGGTLRSSTFTQGAVTVLSRVQATATGALATASSSGSLALSGGGAVNASAVLVPIWSVSIGASALQTPSQQVGMRLMSRRLGSHTSLLGQGTQSTSGANLHVAASTTLAGAATGQVPAASWAAVHAAAASSLLGNMPSLLNTATPNGLGPDASRLALALGLGSAVQPNASASTLAAACRGAQEWGRAGWASAGTAPTPSVPDALLVNSSSGTATIVTLAATAGEMQVLGWTPSSATVFTDSLAAALVHHGVQLQRGSFAAMQASAPAQHHTLRLLPPAPATSTLLPLLAAGDAVNSAAATAAMLQPNPTVGAAWWPAVSSSLPAQGLVFSSEVGVQHLAAVASKHAASLNGHPDNELYSGISRGGICVELFGSECATPARKLAALAQQDAESSRSSTVASISLPPGNRVLITEGRSRLARSLSTRAVTLSRLLAYSQGIATTQASNTLASRFTGSFASAMTAGAADVANVGSGAVLTSMASSLASQTSALQLADMVSTQQYYGGTSPVAGSAERGLYSAASAGLWLPRLFYSLEATLFAVRQASVSPFAPPTVLSTQQAQALLPLLAPAAYGRPLPTYTDNQRSDSPPSTPTAQGGPAAALFTDSSASRGEGYILIPAGLMVASSHGASTSIDGSSGLLQRLLPTESDDVYIASVGGVFGMVSAALNVSSTQTLASLAMGRGSPFIATGGLGPRRALVHSSTLTGGVSSSTAHINAEATAAFLSVAASWATLASGSSVSSTGLSAPALARVVGLAPTAAAASLQALSGYEGPVTATNAEKQHAGFVLTQLQTWAMQAVGALALGDWASLRLGNSLDLIVHCTVHRAPLNEESDLWTNIAFIVAVGAILLSVVLTATITTALAQHARKVRAERLEAQLAAVRQALQKMSVLSPDAAGGSGLAVQQDLAVLSSSLEGKRAAKAAGAGAAPARQPLLSKTLQQVQKDQAASSISQAVRDARSMKREAKAGPLPTSPVSSAAASPQPGAIVKSPLSPRKGRMSKVAGDIVRMVRMSKVLKSGTGALATPAGRSFPKLESVGEDSPGIAESKLGAAGRARRRSSKSKRGSGLSVDVQGAASAPDRPDSRRSSGRGSLRSPAARLRGAAASIMAAKRMSTLASPLSPRKSASLPPMSSPLASGMMRSSAVVSAAAAAGQKPGQTEETFDVGIWTTFRMLYPVVRGIVMEGGAWDMYRSRVAAAEQSFSASSQSLGKGKATTMNPLSTPPAATVKNPMANLRRTSTAGGTVLPLSAREQTLFRRARQFIHYYVSDAHPLETLYFEARSHWAREWSNRVVSTKSYTVTVYIFLVLFLGLAFWEAGPTASLAGTIPLTTPAAAVGAAGDLVVGVEGVDMVQSVTDLPPGVTVDGQVGRGNVLFASPASEDTLITIGSNLQAGSPSTASAGTGLATLRMRSFGGAQADSGIVSGWYLQKAYAWSLGILDRGSWGDSIDVAAQENGVPGTQESYAAGDVSSPLSGGSGVDQFGVQREDEWLRGGVLRVELLCLLILVADTLLIWYARGVRRHYVRLFDAAAPWCRRYAKWQSMHHGAVALGMDGYGAEGDSGMTPAKAALLDEEDAADAAIGTCSARVADVLYGLATCGARRRAKYYEEADGKPRAVKREGQLRTLFLVRVVLLFIFVVDWCARVFVGYRTGRTSTLLPVTAILRPLYIIARVPTLRSALGSFSSTLILARRVLALFASFLAVTAGVSIALLSSRSDLRFPVFTDDAAVAAAAGGANEDSPASSGDDAVIVASAADATLAASISALSALASNAAGMAGAVASAAGSGFQRAVSLPQALSTEGDGSGRGFSEFQSAWITMFVFVTTGENYNEVVYRASDTSSVAGGRLAVLFKPMFIVISFIGLFILVSLLIAHFQERFSESESRTREARTQKRRLALVLAFSLLDDDGSGCLERKEYARFLASSGVKTEHYEKLPDRLGPPEFVHLCEYLIVKKNFNFERRSYQSERLIFTMVTKSMNDGLRRLALLGCILRSQQWLQRFFNNELDVKFDSFILGVVIINTWAICLFGTKLGPFIDSVLPIFVLLYALELLLRIAAVGWKRFWYGKKKATRQVVTGASNPAAVAAALSRTRSTESMPSPTGSSHAVHMARTGSLRRIPSSGGAAGSSRMNAAAAAAAAAAASAGSSDDAPEEKQAPFQTAANRYDFFIIVLTIIVALASLFVTTSSTGGFQARLDSVDADSLQTLQVNDLARLSMVLPVLRLFSVVHATRALVFGLIAQAHKFLSILALLLLVMYAFAVLGIWAFAGLMSDLPPSVVGIMRNANFDTFESAMSTLYVLMLAESWNDIMYALVDASNSINPAFYFMAYVALVAVLFSQVFVGITIDVAIEIERERENADDVDEGFTRFMAAYGDRIADESDDDDVEGLLSALKEALEGGSEDDEEEEVTVIG